MRHGRGRVEPVRIIALATRERSRARADLYHCFALLIGAIATLAAVVAFLVMSPGVAVSPSNFVAARWLLASLGLVTATLAFFSARLFLRRSAELPSRRLSVYPTGIVFEAPARQREQVREMEERLLDFSRSFGMTLLANRLRDRLVLAVTSSGQAAYFAARVDPEERQAYRRLLSSASTVSDDDAVLDAMGPDGAPLELRLRDLNALMGTLLKTDGDAFDRCFLSDTQGAPVVLDGHELRIGRKGFDLRAPLEWRAMLFQESFGAVLPMSDEETTPSPTGGVMVYQATWVRQGMSEAILVSLIASISSVSPPTTPPSGEVPEVASAVLRDLRLMQASPEPPPPAELRVGIERMFMVRLRAALDRAPRASHKDIPSGAAVP